ncbi:sodium/hydrogen exchanger 9B2-like [Saccostrea cucullata]|uniref:sodium/hydrogen exchanger 9B2-like n=1 Tax=Saccostrea cuccullata TaxID=36930 RepID=UPI002ED3277E
MSFRNMCTFEPRGVLAMMVQFFVLLLMVWTVTLSITDQSALPGGHLFSLIILFVSAVSGGYIFSLIRLPPLLGMILAGFGLSNLPVVCLVGQNVTPIWSGALRRIALTVILIRAGLGLDPVALKKLSRTVIKLAFLPCISESVICAVTSHYLIGLPWDWSFMLGFVLSAISPAVVVPALLNLAERGYGLDKGIPTLVIAAASIDDVVCISGFGIALGIAFSTGDLALTIARGPLEAMLGVAYGVVLGLFLWIIPAKDSSNLIFYRAMLLFSGGMLATFGSVYADLSGAGPLGCLVLAFVCGIRWRKESTKEQYAVITDAVGLLWMIFQPLLFGLIGAAVRVEHIQNLRIVGLGIAVLFIGLMIRCLVTFVAVFRSGLNFKEQLFVSLAWIPKATVQAAIGGLALDQATHDKDEELKPLGIIVLTIAVLSIMITAPIGALAIAVSGPRCLKHDSEHERRASTSQNEETTDNTQARNGVICNGNVREKVIEDENVDIVVTHI